MDTRLTRELPCRLTESEIAERALLAARTTAQHEAFERKAKDAASENSRELKRLFGEMRRLSRVVDAGEETRPVDCFVVYDRAAGRAVVVRADTEAVIETRTMNAAEIEAVDAGDLEAGVVPERAQAQVDYLEKLEEINRKRAEFSLLVWAGADLSETQIDKLVEAGLCEVEALLSTSVPTFAGVAGCTKKHAARILDRVALEFVPPAPPTATQEEVPVEAEV